MQKRTTYRYDEFAIKLDAAREGFRATVLEPSGGAEVDFLLPDDLEEQIRDMATAALSRGDTSRSWQPPVSVAAPTRPSADLGADLFRLIFSDKVLKSYEAVKKRRQGTNRLLRLRLQIDDAAPELMRVPWECLTDGSIRLALIGSVVRELATQDSRPRTVQRMNMLVIVADPPELRQLDVTRECDGIMNALRSLRDLGTVKVEVIRGDREVLSDHLRRANERNHDYHVVHYIGHGGMRPDGESYLCLEGEGDGRELTGTQLAELLLRWAPTVRLVFLNACHSSSVATTKGFGGLAQALAGAGIPLIIAMQFAVSDVGAITYSAQLYREIAANTPIHVALLSARDALDRKHPDEWATPTIYLAKGTTELFRLKTTAGPGDGRAAEPVDEHPAPVDDVLGGSAGPPDPVTFGGGGGGGGEPDVAVDKRGRTGFWKAALTATPASRAANIDMGSRLSFGSSRRSTQLLDQRLRGLDVDPRSSLARGERTVLKQEGA